MSNLVQKNNITLCPISDYSLKKSEDDKAKITNLGLDILIVLGWQRIIPAWLLEILDIGALECMEASYSHQKEEDIRLLTGH